MTITPTDAEPTGSQSDGRRAPVYPDPTFDLPFPPIGASDSSKPKPARRTARRKNSSLFPAESPVQHHALYRLYNADGALLYVGETNSPVERYIEHRETKEWWPEVAAHSIYWSQKGRAEVQEMEKRAIRDEWPRYNVAHQPRGDGMFSVPSYVAKQICAVIEQQVREVFGEDSKGEAALIARNVDYAFKCDGDGEWGEIGFEFELSPRTEPLDLDAVLDALGPFRPDIDNSMRDPKPQGRKSAHCGEATERGRCRSKIRRDGSCPKALLHVGAAEGAHPLDTVADA